MAAYDRDNSPRRNDPDGRTRRMRQVEQDVEFEAKTDHAYVYEHARRMDIYSRASTVVWTLTGFVEIVVAIRIIFKLIGANAGNGFVRFIYDISGVFVNPFQGIVRDVSSGSSVFEINSLIAMLIFILIAWGVLKLFWLILTVTEPSDD